MSSFNYDKVGIELLEELTTNADNVQKTVLEEILTQNAKTEYLMSFLNGKTEKSHFKEKVPVVNYEDIKPYIDRIANGEPHDIISAEPIIELLTSSGTSGGKPKMIPSTAEELDRKAKIVTSVFQPVMNQYIDGFDQGKGMHILFTKPETITPSGLEARTALNSMLKRSSLWKNFIAYTSPEETILCLDIRQSMYCQLLCGLVQRDEVVRVGAPFASAFLRVIKFLEDNWKELCANIRYGEVSDWITDTGCRNAVSSIICKPNPNLGILIEGICSAKSWEGIIKKLWPKTKCIEVIVTGSMAQYVPMLEFYSGGLPLVSTMYVASECLFGINLKPLNKPSDVSYTFLPNMAYFEFLPVEKNHGNIVKEINSNEISSDLHCIKEDDKVGEPVDLVDVKLGHHYEVIVTTYAGLYRYRVGDILMVTGFYNNAPQFKFARRGNVVLSIDTDKTNEEDLLNAVTQAKLLLKPLGFILTDYTSYADTSSIPGHYVLFWELKRIEDTAKEELDPSILEECCSRVEELLDFVYRRCRSNDHSIGPLEIRVVKEGTFDALMDFCVSQGSSINQYKTPRCIQSKATLEILNSRVMGRFFSTKTPFWEPLKI